MEAQHVDQSTVKPKTPEVKNLLEQCKTLILATINKDGTPLSSTVPYARVENEFFVYVSYMAMHTKNLIDRKVVSVMLTEDEASSKQLFARHRLTLQSESCLVEKDTELYKLAMADLEQRHGKIVQVLQSMDDFVLISLKPIKGTYVNGFGSAYFVNADLEVQEHRTGEHGGHNR